MPTADRRLSLLAVLVCAALVATTSVAAADRATSTSARTTKLKHVGSFEGMPGSRVTFTVVKRGGELRRVENVRVDGFAVFCTEGLSTQRVSVTFPDFKIVTRGSKGGFGASDLPHRVEGFEHAFKTIAGVLRARGRSASGYVRLRWYHDGPGSCGSRQMPWSSTAR